MAGIRQAQNLGDDADERLAEAVLRGERRALARAITLVESTRSLDRERTERIIERILPATGRAIRLGISGVPGVGKSTFIERFGLDAIAAGRRVAVLAIDPSSMRTGGSILGDKTRMEKLSTHRDAFIRPSPAGRTLGGVARRTREALLLAEAAGYDLVIVETVGVGQSETAVAEMTDMLMLLLPPGGGDDLQGIKKGIVEMADIILVNKADGDLEAAARRAVSDYRKALHMLRPADPDWRVDVAACSAATGAGMTEAWELVLAHDRLVRRDEAGREGPLGAKRARQARRWLRAELEDGLLRLLEDAPGLAERLAEAEQAVEGRRESPPAAAKRLIAAFRKSLAD